MIKWWNLIKWSFIFLLCVYPLMITSGVSIAMLSYGNMNEKIFWLTLYSFYTYLALIAVYKVYKDLSTKFKSRKHSVE